MNVSHTIFINPLGKTLTISFREKIVKYKMLRKMRILDKIMWRMIIIILYPLVINCPVPKSFKSNWLYVGGYWFQIFEKGLVEMSFKKKKKTPTTLWKKNLRLLEDGVNVRVPKSDWYT